MLIVLWANIRKQGKLKSGFVCVKLESFCFSARAASAFNHRAISPGQVRGLVN